MPQHVVMSRQCFTARVRLNVPVMSLCPPCEAHPNILSDFGSRVAKAPPGYCYRSGDPIELSVLMVAHPIEDVTPVGVFSAIEADDLRPVNFIEYLWALQAFGLLVKDGRLPIRRLAALGTRFESAIRGEGRDRFVYMTNDDFSAPVLGLISHPNIGSVRGALAFVALPKGIPAPIAASPFAKAA